MNYDSVIKTAIRLISENGRIATLVLENDTADTDKPWESDASKEERYDVLVCFLPPVNGIYFHHTRFGTHKEYINNEYHGAEQISCMVAPLFKDGVEVDLSKATAIIDNGVKYKVVYCDVIKPAKQTVLYSFALGR